MKILLATLCWLTVAATAHAGFDSSGWYWQRPMDVQSLSGFVSLPIPPEVFDESQPSLNDLRVVDENNALVPHVIHWGRIRETRQQEWKSVRLVNTTFAPGKYSRVTVDFGEMVEKNLIQVSLSGQNYRRRALLEGSNESKGWEVVAEDLWLFDVSMEGQNFKIDTIKFPTNNFRYLRLTVYNMTDDPRRITIGSVKGAFHRVEVEKELVPVHVKQMSVSSSEDKKQSILEFDLGFRHLPVISLELGVTTSYFYRGYELYGRNELKEKVPRKTETGSDIIERETPWRSVHRGVLYRIQHKNKTTESLKVENLSAPYRYLKLRILNGDNPPVQIGGVSIHRRETSLMFQAQTGKQYRLVGGNSNVGGADYDLAKAVQGLDETKLPVVSLGPATVIAPKEPLRPWTERYSVVIWIVLIIAVGVMVGFIVKNLKKLPISQK
jgi:hypothetical protein